MIRKFKCWYCDFIEEVKGVLIKPPYPDEAFYIFGSSVDFCNLCGEARRWESEEICLDEIAEAVVND